MPSTGCFPDDVPGLQGLIHWLPLTLSFEPAAIAVRGTQSITDASVTAGRKLGVTYATASRSTGSPFPATERRAPELTDRSHISAQLVVSNLGLSETVLAWSRVSVGDWPIVSSIRWVLADQLSGELVSKRLASSHGEQPAEL